MSDVAVALTDEQIESLLNEFFNAVSDSLMARPVYSVHFCDGTPRYRVPTPFML